LQVGDMRARGVVLHNQRPLDGPTGGRGSDVDDSLPEQLAQVCERLAADFAGEVSVVTVTAVVWRCWSDLDSVHESALAEMTERLARHRLSELTRQPNR
jgi:hypothetical protein